VTGVQTCALPISIHLHTGLNGLLCTICRGKRQMYIVGESVANMEVYNFNKVDPSN
jgi:hypothetical protein